MKEWKNHISKYVDGPREFSSKATELNIQVLKSQKHIQTLIQKARNDENLGDFLVLSAKINELTIEFLAFTKDFIQEVSNDSKAIIKGSELRNTMRDHLDTIENLISQREHLINELAKTKRITK